MSDKPQPCKDCGVTILGGGAYISSGSRPCNQCKELLRQSEESYKAEARRANADEYVDRAWERNR